MTVDRADFQKTLTIQHNSIIPGVQNWKKGILRMLLLKGSKEAFLFPAKRSSLLKTCSGHVLNIFDS